MKFNKIFLITGMMGTMALAALAVPDEVNITANVRTQNGNVTSGNANVSQTAPMTWNNAKVYSLISAAVANVGTNGTGIASTNLPSDGYLGFNPNGTDGNVYGTFYITNKTGFSYPLSGVDTNGNYYSFVELDTYLGATDNTTTNATVTGTNVNTSTNNPAPLPGLIDFGFSDNFNGVETGRFNSVNGGGGESIVSTALFYVHDNPYAFNGGNNPNGIYNNNNAFEILGVADTSLTYKDGDVLHWTLSLQGSGNAIVNSSQNAVVVSGHVGVSQ